MIHELTGFDGAKLLQFLHTKKSFTEEQIAKAFRMDLNLVRNRLYTLQHHNLVVCDREKDTKHNIYIYHWSYNSLRLGKLQTMLEKTRMERVSHQLAVEQNTTFYLCETDHFRIEFEKASEYHFKCPECGKLMELEDNREKILHLKKELEQYEKSVM